MEEEDLLNNLLNQEPSESTTAANKEAFLEGILSGQGGLDPNKTALQTTSRTDIAPYKEYVSNIHGVPVNENLNDLRATNQSTGEKVGKSILNFVSEATIGTAQAITDIPDVIRAIASDKGLYSLADEHFRNDLSKALGDLKKEVNQDVFLIDSGDSTSADFYDSVMDGLTNGTLASGLTALLPGLGVGRAASLGAKGLTAGVNALKTAGKAARIAKGLNRNEQLIGALAGAAYSNLWESMGSAAELFPEKKKELQQLGYSEEQIKKIIEPEVKKLFLTNSINAPLDMLGLYSMMKPFRGTRNILRAGNVKGTISKEVIPEGVQEVVNHFSEQSASRNIDIAKGLPATSYGLTELMEDGRSYGSFALGAAGGAGFTIGGNVANQIGENLSEQRGVFQGLGTAISSGNTISEREKIEKQQEEIENLRKVNEELDKEFIGIENVKKVAEDSGEKSLYNSAQSELLINRGLSAMNNGTFGKLLNTLDKSEQVLKEQARLFDNTEEVQKEYENTTNEALQTFNESSEVPFESFEELEESIDKNANSEQPNPEWQEFATSEVYEAAVDAKDNLETYSAEGKKDEVDNTLDHITQSKKDLLNLEQKYIKATEVYAISNPIYANEFAKKSFEIDRANKNLQELNKVSDSLRATEKYLKYGSKHESNLKKIESAISEMATTNIEGVESAVPIIGMSAVTGGLGALVGSLISPQAAVAAGTIGAISPSVGSILIGEAAETILPTIENIANSEPTNLLEKADVEMAKELLRIQGLDSDLDNIITGKREKEVNTLMAKPAQFVDFAINRDEYGKIDSMLNENELKPLVAFSVENSTIDRIYNKAVSPQEAVEEIKDINLTPEGKDRLLGASRTILEQSKKEFNSNISEPINQLIQDEDIRDDFDQLMSMDEFLSTGASELDTKERRTELNSKRDAILRANGQDEITAIENAVSQLTRKVPGTNNKLNETAALDNYFNTALTDTESRIDSLEDINPSHLSTVLDVANTLSDYDAFFKNDERYKIDYKPLEARIAEIAKKTATAKRQIDEILKQEEGIQQAAYDRHLQSLNNVISLVDNSYQSRSAGEIAKRLDEIAVQESILTDAAKDQFTANTSLGQGAYDYNALSNTPDTVLYAHTIKNKPEGWEDYSISLNPNDLAKHSANKELMDAYTELKTAAMSKIISQSDIKLSSILNTEMKLSDSNEAPTQEQQGVLREAALVFGSNIPFMYLQGLAGTGKSNFTSRKLVDMLKDLGALQSNEVFTLAKGARADEVINKSIKNDAGYQGVEWFNNGDIQNVQELKENLRRSKLVILDEIGKLGSEEYRKFIDLVDDVNRETNNQVTVLFTGDPQQTRGAEFTAALDSNTVTTSGPNRTHILPALTVSQRTNDPSVLQFQNKFLSAGDTNVFESDFKGITSDTSETEGVSKSTSQDQFNGAITRSTGSRGIITTDEKIPYYEQQFPDIYVGTANQSQGLDFENVFIDIPNEKQGVLNEFNKTNEAFYVAASRAKEYINVLDHKNEINNLGKVPSSTSKGERDQAFTKKRTDNFERYLKELEEDMAKLGTSVREREKVVEEITTIDNDGTQLLEDVDTQPQDISEEIVESGDANVSQVSLNIADPVYVHPTNHTLRMKEDGKPLVNSGDSLEIGVRQDSNKNKPHFVLYKKLKKPVKGFSYAEVGVLNGDYSDKVLPTTQLTPSGRFVNSVDSIGTVKVSNASKTSFVWGSNESLDNNKIKSVVQEVAKSFDRPITDIDSRLVTVTNRTKDKVILNESANTDNLKLKKGLTYLEVSVKGYNQPLYIPFDTTKLNESSGPLSKLIEFKNKVMEVESMFEKLGFKYKWGDNTQTTETYNDKDYSWTEFKMFMELLKDNLDTNIASVEKFQRAVDLSPDRDIIRKAIGDLRSMLYVKESTGAMMASPNANVIPESVNKLAYQKAKTRQVVSTNALPITVRGALQDFVVVQTKDGARARRSFEYGDENRLFHVLISYPLTENFTFSSTTPKVEIFNITKQSKEYFAGDEIIPRHRDFQDRKTHNRLFTSTGRAEHNLALLPAEQIDAVQESVIDLIKTGVTKEQPGTAQTAFNEIANANRNVVFQDAVLPIKYNDEEGKIIPVSLKNYRPTNPAPVRVLIDTMTKTSDGVSNASIQKENGETVSDFGLRNNVSYKDTEKYNTDKDVEQSLNNKLETGFKSIQPAFVELGEINFQKNGKKETSNQAEAQTNTEEENSPAQTVLEEELQQIRQIAESDRKGARKALRELKKVYPDDVNRISEVQRELFPRNNQFEIPDADFKIGNTDTVPKGSTISKEQAVKIAKELLPDITEDEIQSLALLGNVDSDVLGKFREGIVFLLEDLDGNIQEETLRHELFHKLFQQYLTPSERVNLLTQVSKSKDFASWFNLNFPNLKPKSHHVEEYMARRFQRFNLGESTSLLTRFFNWLKAQLNNLRHVFTRHEDDILIDLFRRVHKGLYSERIVDNTQVTAERYLRAIDRYFPADTFVESVINYFNTKNALKDLLSDQFSGIPTTLNDAVVEIKQSVEDELDARLEDARIDIDDFFAEDFEEQVAMLEDHKEIIPYLYLSLKAGNDFSVIDTLVSEMFDKFSATNNREFLERLDRIEDSYEETLEQLEIGLTDEIVTNSEVDYEGKISQKLKEFFNFLKVGDIYINPRFAYAKTLSIFQSIDLNNLSIRELEFMRDNDSKQVESITVYNKLIGTINTANGRYSASIPFKEGIKYIDNNTTRGSEFYVNGVRIPRKSRNNNYYNAVADIVRNNEVGQDLLDSNIDIVDYLQKLAVRDTALQTLRQFQSEIGSQIESNPNVALWVETRTQDPFEEREIRNQEFRVVAVKPADVVEAIRESVAQAILDKPGFSSLRTQDLNRIFKFLELDYSKQSFTDEVSIRILENFNLVKRSLQTHSNKERALEQSNNALKNIASALSKNEDFVSAQNYLSDNKRKYIFVNGSWIYDSLQSLAQGKLPEFLNSYIGNYSIFKTGLNKVHNFVNLENIDQKNVQGGSKYDATNMQNFRPVDYYQNGFLHSYMGVLTRRASSPRYMQYTYTQSNRPSLVAAELNLMTPEQLDSVITLNRALEKNRPKRKDLKTFKDKVLFTDNISQEIDAQSYDSFNTMMDLFDETNIINSSRFTQVDEALNNLIDNGIVTLEGASQLVKTFMEDASDRTFTNVDALSRRQKLFVLYNNFHRHNYIVGHQLNMHVFGDIAYAKNPEDVIKRMQGVQSPGKKQLIGELGNKPKVRAVVAQDQFLTLTKLNDIRDRFGKILGEPIEYTDAVTFATPEVIQGFKDGTGDESLGDIVKTVTFYIDDAGVTHYVKTAVYALNDQLVTMFPELKAIRDDMNTNKVDYLTFPSAYKLGAPSKNKQIAKGNKIKPNNIVEWDNRFIRIQANPIHQDGLVSNVSQFNYFTNVNGLNEDLAFTLWDLDRKLIGDQFEGWNSTTKLINNGKVNAQNLVKVLKKALKGTNDDRVWDILNELGPAALNYPSLIDKMIIQLSNIVSKNSVEIKHSGNKLVNNPALGVKLYNNTTYNELSDADKVKSDNFYKFSQPLQSALEQLWDVLSRPEVVANKDAFQHYTELKSSGGGLDLSNLSTSDQVIFNRYEQELLNKDELDIIIPRRLRIRDENNYAEVVVPKWWATQFSDHPKYQELLKTGFAIRIPTTGIHSALPIKIVGFSDTMTNRIIAPEELVILHGSDFDIDSLFAMHREVFSKDFGPLINKDARLAESLQDELAQVRSLISDKFLQLNPEVGERYKAMLDNYRVALANVKTNVPLEQNEDIQIEYIDYISTPNYSPNLGKSVVRAEIPGFDDLRGKIEFAAHKGYIYSESNDTFRIPTDEEGIAAALKTQLDLFLDEHNSVLRSNKDTWIDLQALFNTQQEILGQIASNQTRVYPKNTLVGYTSEGEIDTQLEEYIETQLATAAGKNRADLLEVRAKILKNRKLDNYLDLVTAEQNESDMDTPISFDAIKLDVVDTMLDPEGNQGELYRLHNIFDDVAPELFNDKGEIDKSKFKISGNSIAVLDKNLEQKLLDAPIGVNTKLKILKGTLELKESSSGTGRDLNNFKDQMLYHKDNFEGLSGTGIEANIMKVGSYLLSSSKVTVNGKEVRYANIESIKNLSNVPNENVEVTLTNGTTITGKLERQEVKILDQKGNPKVHRFGGRDYGTITNTTKVHGVPTHELGDTVLNGYIDNVKEQVTSIINASPVTINSIGYMIYLGFDLDTITYLMNQPVIKDISTSNRGLTRRINDRLKQFEAKLKTDVPIELNNGMLEAGIRDGKSIDSIVLTGSVEQQLTQYSALKLFNSIQTEANQFNKLSQMLGVLKSLPILTPDIQNILDLKAFVESDRFRFDAPNLLDIPHIQAALQQTNSLRDIIGQSFKIRSPKVAQFINSAISDLNFRLRNTSFNNAEVKAEDYMTKEFESFLLSAYVDKLKQDGIINPEPDAVAVLSNGALISKNDLSSYDRNQLTFISPNQVWVQQFAENLKKMPKGNNKFLKFFTVRTAANGLHSVRFSGGTAIKNDRELLFKDFMALDPLVRQDFLTYSVLGDRGKFGFRGFSNILPPKSVEGYRDGLDNVINFYDDFLNSVDNKLDNLSEPFKIQFVLNNAEHMTNPHKLVSSQKAADIREVYKIPSDYLITEATKPFSDYIVLNNVVYASDQVLELDSKYYTYFRLQPVEEHNYYEYDSRFEDGNYDRSVTKSLFPDEFMVLERQGNLSKSYNMTTPYTIKSTKGKYTAISAGNRLEVDFKREVELTETTTDKVIVPVKESGKVVYDDEGNMVTTESERTINNYLITDTYTRSNQQRFSLRNSLSRGQARVIADKLATKFGIDYEFVDVDANWKGKFENGKVYLNTRQLSADTPFHEFAHPFVASIKNTNKRLYNSLVNEIKNTPYGQSILARVQSQYPELSTNDQLEEAIVTAIGDLAAGKVESGGLMRLVKRLLQRIGELLSNIFPQRILPKDLDPNMSLESLASVLTNQSPITVDSLSGTYFSKITPDNIEVYNDEQYTDGKKFFDRVSHFIKNFSNQKLSSEEYYAEQAKKTFAEQNIPLDGKITIRVANEEVQYTYDEYVQFRLDKLKRAQGLGKWVHKFFETKVKNGDSTELNKIKDEFELDESDISPYNDEVFERALAFMGLSNTELDKVQNEIALKVDIPELKSGIGGTMDWVIDHNNDTYSIIDFKTGALSTKASGFLEGSKLENSALNRAKLQVMLYALMTKAQNPNAKFRRLQLLKIDPNSGEDLHTNIVPGEMLPILDKWFKKNAPKWYSKNTKLFTEDYLEPDQVLEARKKKKPNDFKGLLDDLFRELNGIMVGMNKNSFKQLDLEDQAGEKNKYRATLERIISLVSGSNILKEQKFKETTALNAVLGTIQDQANPLIQAFEKVFNRANFNLRDEKIKDFNNFDKVNKVFAAATKNKNYKEAYNFAWDTSGDIITYHNDKWNSLDTDQKKLLDHYRWMTRYRLFETMAPHLGIDFINKELLERSDLTKGDRDMLNNQVKKLQKLSPWNKFIQMNKGNFTYYEGWTPRISKTSEESSNLKEYMKRLATEKFQIEEHEYVQLAKDDKDRMVGLPLKYMPRGDVKQRQLDGEFTYNLELLFKEFNANLLNKKHYDDVYNLGVGLSEYLKEDPDNQFEYLSQFFEGFLRAVVTQQKKDQLKGRHVTVAGKKYSLDKIIRSSRSYFSRTSMALKPVQAVRIGISQTLLTGVEAITGSMSEVFFGQPADFTLGDMWNTLGEVAFSSKDRAKLTSLNRRFEFTPDTSDYRGPDEIRTKRGYFFKTPKVFDKSIDVEYGLYQLFDNFNYKAMLSAQLKKMKTVDKEGNEITMWEAYDSQGNYTGGARGVDNITGEVVAELTADEVAKLKAVTARIMGSYRPEEKTALESTTFGFVYMQFKKFLPPILKRAYSGKRASQTFGQYMESDTWVITQDNHPDFMKEVKLDSKEYKQLLKDEVQLLPKLDWDDRVTEGFLRSTGHAMMALLMAGRNRDAFKDWWENSSPEQRRNLVLAFNKLGAFFTMSAAVSLVFGNADDDDKNRWKFYATQIMNEQVQEVNIKELTKLMTSVPSLEKATDFMVGLKRLGVDSIIYGERVGSGDRKGELKGLPYIYRNIYGVSQLFDYNQQWKDFNKLEEEINRVK